MHVIKNDDRVLSGDRLLRRVYHALIEDLAEVQSDLVQIEATRKLFGAMALPIKSMLRSGLGAFTNAEDTVRRHEERLWVRHAELVQTISMIESLLAAQNEADLEVLAAFIRDRVKKGK